VRRGREREHAGAASKTPDRMLSGDGGEKLVSREEAPVDVNSKSGPRVVFPPLGQNGFGQPVSFVVQTTGTWEDLDALVKKMLAKIRTNPNLTNADSDLKLDKPRFQPRDGLLVAWRRDCSVRSSLALRCCERSCRHLRSCSTSGR